MIRKLAWESLIEFGRGRVSYAPSYFGQTIYFYQSGIQIFTIEGGAHFQNYEIKGNFVNGEGGDLGPSKYKTVHYEMHRGGGGEARKAPFLQFSDLPLEYRPCIRISISPLCEHGDLNEHYIGLQL